MFQFQDATARIRQGLRAIIAVSGILLAGTSGAMADSYPNAPVKLICDSAPGSANDVTARVLADRLGAIWGQQVIVVNAPGAGGAIAARMAAASAGDGYTLFMPVTSEFIALAGAPGVASNLPVMLERDFKSIGFVNSQPLFIGASPKAPFKNLAEMIAVAKAKPDALSYATTGRGRLTHLAMELLEKSAGVKLRLVSYTGGATQAMADLTSGSVDLVLEAYAGLAGAFQGKLIRPMGTTSLERSSVFPDIPAVSETLPGYSVTAWGILVAPLHTPDAIIRKVNADLKAATADAGLIAKFAANGGQTRYMTPSEVTAFVAAEQAKWFPILEKVMRETP
jgi:tripartite-type tricarboxylate transporter receptor subunit TctC